MSGRNLLSASGVLALLLFVGGHCVAAPSRPTFDPRIVRLRPLPRNRSLTPVSNRHLGQVGKFVHNDLLRALTLLANEIQRPVYIFGSLQYGMASPQKEFRPPNKFSDADVGFVDPLMDKAAALWFMKSLWDRGLPEMLMDIARVPQFSITAHCRSEEEALVPKPPELVARSGVTTNLVILPDTRGPRLSASF